MQSSIITRKLLCFSFGGYNLFLTHDFRNRYFVRSFNLKVSGTRDCESDCSEVGLTAARSS